MMTIRIPLHPLCTKQHTIHIHPIIYIYIYPNIFIYNILYIYIYIYYLQRALAVSRRSAADQNAGPDISYSLWMWGVTCCFEDVSHETPDVRTCPTSPPKPFFRARLVRNAWCNTMSHLTATGCTSNCKLALPYYIRQRSATQTQTLETSLLRNLLKYASRGYADQLTCASHRCRYRHVQIHGFTCQRTCA